MSNDERTKITPELDDVVLEPDSLKDPATAMEDVAEAEAAAAEAQAAAARAVAVRLRRQAEGDHDHSGDADAAETDTEAAVVDAPATGNRGPLRPRLRRPTKKAITISGAILIICASLALTGLFAWTDRVSAQKRQRSSEFAVAARQDVVALLSLHFNKSKEDMQRISDNSTGTFKQHFPVVAAQLTEGLQRSKVVTTASVNDVAVESMTENSAVVLVAATTEAKVPDEPQPPDSQPQRTTWQIVLTLLRDKGQPKMSNVEFVQ